MRCFGLVAAFAAFLFLAGCSHQSPPPSACNCLMGLTPGSEQDLVSNVGDRVFFAFNKSTLTNDSHATLARQSNWLAEYPAVNVLVAGNADERGTETYNLALGEKRATAVRDLLVAQGVAAARIKTISYGKDCPVASGNDEASYRENRNAITSVVGYNPQGCH